MFVIQAPSLDALREVLPGFLEAARARLFDGEIVNLTEGRPALHMALRAAAGADFKAAGKPVSEEVEDVRDAMQDFVAAVRSGMEWPQMRAKGRGRSTG